MEEMTNVAKNRVFFFFVASTSQKKNSFLISLLFHFLLDSAPMLQSNCALVSYKYIRYLLDRFEAKGNCSRTFPFTRFKIWIFICKEKVFLQNPSCYLFSLFSLGQRISESFFSLLVELHLHEGLSYLLNQNTMCERKEKKEEKYPAPSWIRTHNLWIMRRMLETPLASEKI